MNNWHDEIYQFIELTTKHEVKMILVGGGAVNFHGYQRSSIDVDFWIDLKEENLSKLILVLNEMGYQINDFPKEIKEGMQNISIKLTQDIELELITRFSINKSFDQAYKDAIYVKKNEQNILYWHVLSYDDLITSKIKSNRPKDLLDIQQLEKIKKQK
jgi:hypothetical protein